MIPMPHSLFATPAPAHQGTPVRVMTIPGTFIAAALGVAKTDGIAWIELIIEVALPAGLRSRR
ncbi:hypothetical protein GCM10010434_060420 [Winogradskya humida]